MPAGQPRPAPAGGGGTACAPHRNDTLDELLAADRPALLDWLRHQPLALHEVAHGADGACRRAAVVDTRPDHPSLAGEVETVLRSPDCADFLQQMYGNKPSTGATTCTGMKRLRGDRQRADAAALLHADGTMDFDTKEGAAAAPAGFMPWFDVPGRRTAGTTVAFGHWSTLGWLPVRCVLSLDTGCVWGGA
jgi:bis(5'-nucleosyl)-tetraphosphatase (symmetrical)